MLRDLDGLRVQLCSLTQRTGTAKAVRLHVVGPACGGMHDLGGVVGQIYGGTLPAKVFARTQALLAQVRAARSSPAPMTFPARPTSSPTPDAILPSPAPRRPRPSNRTTPTGR